MPILSANQADFVIRVRDKLTYGQDHGTRAQVNLSATHVVVGQTLVVKAANFGTAANSYTVVVNLPGGTSALSAAFSNNILTINLGVSSGVAVVGANTLNLIATAINGITGSPFLAYASGTGLGEIRSAVLSTAFAGGTAGRDGVPSAPQPYLLAQDSATLLQLFQSQLSKALVTATGGSATTAVVTSMVANEWRGAKVTFASNTTTVLLRGVTARVLSNTGTTFTFTSTLPASVANTDTFSIQHDLLDTDILLLRQGRTGLGDSPAANVYGYNRTVMDAFSKLITLLGGTAPSQTLSWPGATTAAGSTTSVINVNETYRVDEFKNKFITISGATRAIISNTANQITVAPAFSVAPAGSTAYSITVPILVDYDYAHAQPGPHPWNYVLAALITVALAEVNAAVLPA